MQLCIVLKNKCNFFDTNKLIALVNGSLINKMCYYFNSHIVIFMLKILVLIFVYCIKLNIIIAFTLFIYELNVTIIIQTIKIYEKNFHFRIV